ncbi:MAG: hypothetical protein ACRDTC_02105 [Pseudonocardiaceae bacterium]
MRNWCEVGLERQTFITRIETRRSHSDEWIVTGQSGISHAVPALAGMQYRVRDGRCQSDIEYSTAWRAYGTDRNGLEFDTGTVRRVLGTTGLC